MQREHTMSNQHCVMSRIVRSPFAMGLSLCFVLAVAGCKSGKKEPEPTPEPAAGSPEAAAAAAAAQAAGQGLEGDAQRQSLAQQRNQFLLEQHIGNAETHLKSLRLDEA